MPGTVLILQLVQPSVLPGSQIHSSQARKDLGGLVGWIDGWMDGVCVCARMCFLL